MQWTEILNPGQTCVLGADQTLYAIIKLIQWQFPDTLGEDKLVVIMGTAHRRQYAYDDRKVTA